MNGSEGGLVESLFRLVKSEIHLASAELQDSTEKVGKYMFQSALYGSLAGVSGIPILAFLIIGLGRLLDGDYLLSSLYVASFSAIGGGFALQMAQRKFQEGRVALPRTLEALRKEGQLFSAASRRVADTLNKRRSA